jgi:hypothetical protein
LARGRLLLLIGLVAWTSCLFAGSAARAAEPQVALVASAQSPISALTGSDARRLYLGLPLVVNGHEITPLRNGADPSVQEVFLQRVLFMSAQAYERQMSARVYRSGGNRAPEFTSVRELSQALAGDPWAISYMAPEAAAKDPALKIVGLP